MTVKELIEQLQKYPEDAEVRFYNYESYGVDYDSFGIDTLRLEKSHKLGSMETGDVVYLE
jgi:hypothetical protein